MLGNSRFLIIVIFVLLAVALICLGASASEIAIRDPVDSGGSSTRAVPPTSLGNLPASLFNKMYLLESTASTNGASLVLRIGSGHSISCTYIRVAGWDNGDSANYWSHEYELLFDDPVSVYFTESGTSADSVVTMHVGDDTYVIGSRGYRVYLRLARDTAFDPVTGYTTRTVGGLFNPVPLFDTLLSVGSKLVTFVMSSWVVLVPVVAFVAILGFGVIRRVVKGV